MSAAHPEAVPASPRDAEKGPDSAESAHPKVNWPGDIKGSPTININQEVNIEGVPPSEHAKA